jgi:exopolysaccharide biosynthesis predicted pyruvyltransferase EpsI
MNSISVKEAFISSVGGRPLTIVPNCGNAGDSLINHAIYSLAGTAGVAYEFADPKSLSIVNDERCYLVMVNGGLAGDNANIFDEIIEKINGKAPLVLFSATITDRDDLLKSLHADTVIVCREPVTYEYVVSIRNDITVILSEDATMSIADGSAKLPRRSSYVYWLQVFRSMLKSLYCGKSITVPIMPEKYVMLDDIGNPYLSAYRLDGEKTSIALPNDNLDLSILLSSRRTDPEGSEAAAYLFLEVLKSVPRVKTNRLHVAIGCCLAGTNCEVSANSYFKVKAIYDHSLSRRFSAIASWL